MEIILFHILPTLLPPFLSAITPLQRPNKTANAYRTKMIYINTLFAVLGAIVVGVLADGGYSLNCRNMSLVNLNQKHLGLRAYCDTTTGTPQCSILDLDLCYRTKGNDLKLDPMDK